VADQFLLFFFLFLNDGTALDNLFFLHRVTTSFVDVGMFPIDGKKKWKEEEIEKLMNKEIGKRKKKKKNCDNGPSRQLNPAERRCRRDDRANGPAAVRRSEAGEPEDDGPSTRAVGLLNRPKISES
jgi:hypothetical protein